MDNFQILPIKGGISSVDGFYCDGLNAGLKEKDLDLGFIYSDNKCLVEAVFTKNNFQAAPIRHYKMYPKDFETNFILINSKNANAMTLDEGIEDINYIFKNLKFDVINPISSSTGVIGVRLPVEKIINGANKFNLKSKNSHNLAKAIMTTDSYPKEVAYNVKGDNFEFNIAAVAKGAGMINPNLATMLCFIVTDAKIPKEDMKELLNKNLDYSFNAISVDGDTSTNDSVFLLSNQKNSYNKEAFDMALKMVMKELAIMIVSDGEGAKKLAVFEVKGAKNTQEAKKVAKALSNSLLVKTALFGEDPNFGRIASTIGATKVECDEKKLIISYDDVVVYNKGLCFSEEVEQKAFDVLKKDSFKISCNLGIGDGSFVAYGCDLGYEYVKINADYRT